MFVVYILKSERDGCHYIGYTQNIQRRLDEHNTGKSVYTKRKMPWILVYCETHQTKSEAIKREKFLKAQRNVEFYRKLIENWIGSSVG